MNQHPVTVRAWIEPGSERRLRDVLESIGTAVEQNTHLPIGTIPRVHFARFVILDEVIDLDGEVIPASLIYVASVDDTALRHLGDLVRLAPRGIDAIYENCREYPVAADRSDDVRTDFLRRHLIKTQTFYVNTAGRTVEQIRRERDLREEIEGFLDMHLASQNGAARNAEAICSAIRAHISGNEKFSWAARPAKSGQLLRRVKDLAAMAALVLGGLVLLPIMLIVVPIWLLVIRSKEKNTEWDFDDNRLSLQYRDAPPSEEDHVVHNQFTAIGLMKPGFVRLTTLKVLLWLANITTRHYFNRGNLAGIDALGLDGVVTIHFARWVILDEGRRVIFCSNYDGSLESYMDDFINKVSWGLNLIFSNGVGYPKTRWLVLDGATDEQAFKAYLRRHQLTAQVWYPAYKDLTAINHSNNAEICRGLSQKPDSRHDEAWLRRL